MSTPKLYLALACISLANLYASQLHVDNISPHIAQHISDQERIDNTDNTLVEIEITSSIAPQENYEGEQVELPKVKKKNNPSNTSLATHLTPPQHQEQGNLIQRPTKKEEEDPVAACICCCITLIFSAAGSLTAWCMISNGCS